MKETGAVTWKLTPREMSWQHFVKFSPSENNHAYSIYRKLEQRETRIEQMASNILNFPLSEVWY